MNVQRLLRILALLQKYGPVLEELVGEIPGLFSSQPTPARAPEPTPEFDPKVVDAAQALCDAWDAK